MNLVLEFDIYNTSTTPSTYCDRNFLTLPNVDLMRLNGESSNIPSQRGMNGAEGGMLMCVGCVHWIN
jgi:hypothetical protein